MKTFCGFVPKLFSKNVFETFFVVCVVTLYESKCNANRMEREALASQKKKIACVDSAEIHFGVGNTRNRVHLIILINY